MSLNISTLYTIVDIHICYKITLGRSKNSKDSLKVRSLGYEKTGLTSKYTVNIYRKVIGKISIEAKGIPNMG